MKKTTTSAAALASHTDLSSAVCGAWEAVGQSFDRFCLLAGVSALSEMMEEDATALAGDPYARAADKPGFRWGRTRGRVGFHGGKVEVERPRVRSKTTNKELPLPSWQEAAQAGWLEEWAMSLMLMNVATRKVGRAVRLPEAGVPSEAGSGLSKSAVSRRFKALTEARLAEWMASDLSQPDLLVIQIDGLHMDDNLLMVGAVGVDAIGGKHPLGVVEGATENAATVQAAGQPDRPRTGSCNLPSVHCRWLRRWLQGPDQGDPPDLRGRHPDPALPDPQGAQHHRPARPQASCRGSPGLASGLGNG